MVSMPQPRPDDGRTYLEDDIHDDDKDSDRPASTFVAGRCNAAEADYHEDNEHSGQPSEVQPSASNVRHDPPGNDAAK